MITSDPLLISWLRYGWALATPRQFHAVILILSDVVCWPRFVGFDGGGSGSWLAGEEREANFPRRRVTSLLSLLSSRPISTRYSDWEFTGGRFRREDNSDFSWRMSSFIALISRDISRSVTLDLEGNVEQSEFSLNCSEVAGILGGG